MKFIFNVLLSWCFILTFSTLGFGQAALNVTELGHLSYNETLSEVRGALHNGKEYALVGVNNGFSIVDVTDPANPFEVFFEGGASSIWRDPFYHNGYAYCVTEGGGGLLIVDMSPLPGSTNLTSTLYTGSTYDISSCHNMFIDNENAKCYLFGGNDIDGAIILDLTDPANPVEIGIWNEHYIHDGFVRGDTLWAGCLGEGAFVIDVSVPSSPVELANWDTPSEFAHNIWPSDDNQYSYTTDEVNSGFIAAYDMSNLQNVVETDRFREPLSTGVIPHNAHFLNDFVVTSHYRDGLTIHDVSDPTNVILTGYFDSSPLEGSGFNGAWGAWPYLPSGNILVADIEEGLFILGATYTQAARLEGEVTELGSGNPLNGVAITIVSTATSTSTNIFGDYATGVATAGTYDVTFEKGGYVTETVTGVNLVAGQTLTVDVELEAYTPFILQGLVTETGSGNPIEGATVQITNQFFDVSLTTNAQGEYTDNAFYPGTYEVVVAAWGYVGECQSITASSGSTPPNFELDNGYHDDFAVDLGWSVLNDGATAGIWELGIPVETGFNNAISNPGEDVTGDCGGMAYITGNGGGQAGNDDVDGGKTILKSPMMDLTDYVNPFIQFDYWFFNAGGQSTANDEYVVKIDNGTDVTTIASLPQTNSDWENYSFSIGPFTSISSTMQLLIEVADTDPGHLVEGGLDAFRVVSTVGTINEEATLNVSIYPNPSDDGFVNVNISTPFKNGSVKLTDLSGRLISVNNNPAFGVSRIEVPRTKGFYLLQTTLDEKVDVERLIVQ